MKLNDNLKKKFTKNDLKLNKYRNTTVKSYHNRTFNCYPSNLLIKKNYTPRSYLNKNHKMFSINNNNKEKIRTTNMSIYNKKEYLIPLRYKKFSI